jgi:chromosome partitioning protein
MKGGVGKTTTSIYLANTAARRGIWPVIVVDADPQGSAAEWLSEAPIEGVTLVDAPAARMIERAAMPDSGGVLVIDTPPQVELLSRTAIAHADYVVIPTRTGSTDSSRVMTTLSLIPPGKARGLVICAGRLGTGNLTGTVEGWEANGQTVLGVVPERVGIEVGSGRPRLDDDGMDIYSAIFDRIMSEPVSYTTLTLPTTAFV